MIFFNKIFKIIMLYFAFCILWVRSDTIIGYLCWKKLRMWISHTKLDYVVSQICTQFWKYGLKMRNETQWIITEMFFAAGWKVAITCRTTKAIRQKGSSEGRTQMHPRCRSLVGFPAIQFSRVVNLINNIND